MIKKRQKLAQVMGWEIAPPRLTQWAYVYGIIFLAAPFLLLMLALDVAFYFFFREVLDSCYGILCLLE